MPLARARRSLERLRAVARPNIEFLGWLPRDSMARELERAKCLVFAAEEEFGIVAVEAQAAGTPVVALARGGATETVVPGETGLLFADQTPQSLTQAIRAFEEGELRTDSLRLREHAERFSRERFLKEFRELIDRSWERFGVESEESLRSGDR